VSVEEHVVQPEVGVANRLPFGPVSKPATVAITSGISCGSVTGRCSPAGSELALLHAIVARLALDPEWVPRLSAEMADTINSKLPELTVDEQMASGAHASTLGVVRLFVEMLASGADPAEAEPPPRRRSVRARVSQAGHGH
jgi:hypothetical protein